MINIHPKSLWRLSTTLLVLVLLNACQDPFSLGTELLDEDRAEVGFTDTIRTRTATVPGDSAFVYDFSSETRLSSYLLGDFRDPLFGRSVSSIYTQVLLERVSPNFFGARLDSVVLVLPYDTAGFYGNTKVPFGIEVFELTQSMDVNATYYSNDRFDYDPNPIGSAEFVPFTDSLSVIQYLSATSSQTVRFPHLRVPLSAAFGQQLLNLDTARLKSDTEFLSAFKGIYIRPTKPTPGLISFSLARTPFRGGIYLYYTQSDTIKRQFQFVIDNFAAVAPNYEHDYADAPVAAYIRDYSRGDSVLFVQGMAGLNAEIELQGLEKYRGLVVNKAELEVTVKRLESDDSGTYPPAAQLLVSSPASNGQLILIDDIVLRRGVLETIFGGVYNPSTRTYRMNISAYMQDAIDGKKSNKLYLSIFGKNQSADRVVLYGAGDLIRGTKVKLAFTRL